MGKLGMDKEEALVFWDYLVGARARAGTGATVRVSPASAAKGDLIALNSGFGEI